MHTAKRFSEWIELKEKLHEGVHKPPHVTEGDIWWISLGENIGKEINGKSALFSRPVLVFKKLSHELFLGFPTTSQDRKGSWYISIEYGKTRANVILSQARIFDTKRLSTRIVRLNDADMKKIRTGFKDLFLSK